MKRKRRYSESSPTLKRFHEEQREVLRENDEYIIENGEIVGVRAPNRKKLREFYKKWDRHLRMRKRR